MIQWSGVTWNELEPMLRGLLNDLELTEPEPEYNDEDVRRDRDPVDVAKDIINALESEGYLLVRVQE